MSESHEKETPSAQQNANDQTKPAEKDEFLDALKKEGDEGLKDAFHVLSKGLPTTPLKDVDLQRAVTFRDPKISVQNAKEIIQQVNKEEFSCDDFVYIVNVILAMGAVKKNDVAGLKKAFDVLSKGRPTVRVEDVQLAVTIRDRELLVQNAKEIVQEVNKEGSFNYKEFEDVFKLLEEPGEADQTKNILEKLKGMEDDQQEIILYGRAGVGKTWTAREVANIAVRKGYFDVAIWVYLNRIYKNDDLSLQESIAYQLFVLADFEDAEAEKKAKADEEKKKEPEKKEKASGEEENVKEAKRKREDIEERIVEKLKDKDILFVLDGDGDGSRMQAEFVFEMKKMPVQKEKGKSSDGNKNADEEKEGKEPIVILKLSAGGVEVVRLELGVLKSYKVMKTARKNKLEQGKNGVMVKPFTWEESKLLAARAMENVEELKELARYFMFRSDRLPSELLLISRIVSYFGKKGELGLSKLRNDRDTLKKGEEGVELLNVLIKGYEERLPKSVLIDCYGPDTPENHFMHRGRAVNFNEVICYWIMEGHLGPFGRVDEAYHEGHHVLMELMDCGLLQKQEADYVAPSGTTRFTFHINDYKDFFSCIRPGIGVTSDMSLGRVALADGMIRTISSKSSSSSNNRNQQIISTLLLDGNLIGGEELPTESLSKHKDLVEILAISDPTSQHFELPILEMRNLRLLALRGCQFLGSLEPFLERKPDQEENEQSPQKPGIEGKSDQEKEKSPQKPEKSPQKLAPLDPNSEKLKGLTVLEISGPNSQIKSIPEGLFIFMPNLKTLNLSHLLEVKLLPLSFDSLTQIEFLILRGCKSLQELRSLKNFKDLKILDVSDATNFEKFEDKSLHSNTKLQILNLSKTKVKTLPLINPLKDLKFVWLRDCQVLPRIRKIDKMNKLQIFDISGAEEVERFCDPSLEDLMKLVIVDISGTKIKRLPANLGDPMYLYARKCLKLRVVPPVEGLNKLEVLDLSGCIKLREIRTEFFTNVKGLRDLNLSQTSVQHLPFLGDRVSLRRLLLSGCKLLEKVEKLSCLKELEFLDLSGCEKVEWEEGSFNGMRHLEHLNLSGTSVGGKQTPLPSLSKLESLKQLLVRDCPNLTKLPEVEKVPNLEDLDYSGTVLESPPFKDHPPPPRVVGADIQGIIDTIQLFRNLGAEKGDDQGAKGGFKQEEVSQCKWIISNWRIAAAEKLGTPVYGGHFLRLLKDYPSFLTQNLSKFYFLVYPSEAEAQVKTRFPNKESYIDELSLREIYFEQVCGEKMEKCLEIREFKKLPETLRSLIEQAQFIVLVDDPFLKTLLDLGVDSTMPMKACWIESCNELEHVVAAPLKAEEKTGEAGKGEEGKNGKSVELAKGGGDQRKKVGEKAREAAGKVRGDQKKNAADGKAGEPAKSEGDQQQNAAKSGEPAKGEGDEPKNAAGGNSGESAKGKGDQQKNDAEEKSGDAAKIGDDEPKKNAAEEKSGDAAKSEGDQQKTTAADDKSGDSAKIGGDEPMNAAADKSGESAKGEGDQQKNAAGEKSGDAAKSEGDQQNKTAADTAKLGGDEQKNAAEEKSGDSAKSEGDQQNTAAADTAKVGGDVQKNAAEEKSEDAAKSEGDQQNITATDTAKIGGDEQKNAAKEKSGDSAKSGGDQQKTTTADEKSGDPAKIKGDQAKNSAADDSGESAKIGGDQQKNTAKNEGEEAKNPAEDLNKLETLWISDVSKMKSVCEGDIKTVSFKFLKSLYLEYCPQLSEICSSSLQLESLETLFIKYCQNMKSLFKDENPSKMEKLSHLQLWGLDSLRKINCKTPMLRKLRVGECPLLEHVIASRLSDAEAVGHENEGHENLKILHIKSCNSLKSIFEPLQDDVVFESLTELELLGLPKLQMVARQALALSVLRVGDCPSLTSVITGKDGVRDLETLEVRTCEKMKTIIGVGESEVEKIQLFKLKKIELLGLPELESVGAKLPGNEGYTKRACPKLNDSEFGGNNDA